MIGDYSQTLRISINGGDNTVEVKKGGEVMYNGIARMIEDTGDVLKFVDFSGKKHEYVKYQFYKWA